MASTPFFVDTNKSTIGVHVLKNSKTIPISNGSLISLDDNQIRK